MKKLGTLATQTQSELVWTIGYTNQSYPEPRHNWFVLKSDFVNIYKKAYIIVYLQRGHKQQMETASPPLLQAQLVRHNFLYTYKCKIKFFTIWSSICNKDTRFLKNQIFKLCFQLSKKKPSTLNRHLLLLILCVSNFYKQIEICCQHHVCDKRLFWLWEVFLSKSKSIKMIYEWIVCSQS